MSAVVFYYRRSEFTTDSKFTIRSVFSTGGSFGSTVLRVALGCAFIYEDNETVLGTNPNRTHDLTKPFLETVETVLDLYLDKGMFPFLLCGAHNKNSLKIDAFPFSNRTRNRTRAAAECLATKSEKLSCP